jgi:hypothetical protein
MKKTKYREILLAGFILLMLALMCYPQLAGKSLVSEAKDVKAVKAKAQTQVLSYADGGAWSGLFQTQTVPVHMSLLPDGRLLYWGRDKSGDGTHPGDEYDVGEHSNTYAFEPLYPEIPNPTPSPIVNTSTNLFCSGHSFLPDGRLLVSGGHVRPVNYPYAEAVGETALNIFDYRTNQWTRVGNMPHGRWYPYNVTLGTGETLIMAGSWWNGTTIGTNGFGQPAPLTKDNYIPDIFDLSGGLRSLTDNNGSLFPVIPKYPYISLMPDGKVFIATGGSRPGYTSEDNMSRLLDPYASNGYGVGLFSVVSRPASIHWEGTSVMYAPGKVLMLGGLSQFASGEAGNTAEMIDLNASAPAWVSAGQMALGRHYPTATLLPDGKVLVTGGTSCPAVNALNCGPNGTYGGAVQTPELWDPSNPSVWTQMNPTPSGVPRVYHSVALLMPDARVLVGGSGLPVAVGEPGINGATCTGDDLSYNCKAAGHKNYEYFSPPYLYNADGTIATRPAINFAPDNIAYGDQISINVGNVSPSTIKKVVLIRLPSVTHTYNQDQRLVDLGAPISYDSSYVRVKAPASGNACPPGHYMMFLISNNGRNTPSIAKIVRVGDSAINIKSDTAFNTTKQSFLPTTINNYPLSGSISVTMPTGVKWQVSSNASWVTISSVTSDAGTSTTGGTGSGTVNFNVATNNAPATNTNTNRAGSITVTVTGRAGYGFNYGVFQGGNFLDVLPDNLWYPFISKLHARGITGGCGGGNFCPDRFIKRGEAAVFIASVLHPQTLPAPLTQRFPDVPLSNSFARFIEYVARRDIADGCGSGNFCPDDLLKRKDMVIWLLRGIGIDNPPVPTKSSFSDVLVTDPASPYIEEAVRRGITAGCGNGQFCPNDPLKRGQMATFFVQAFGL